MVINPHVEIVVGTDGGGIQSVTVRAPVKGDNLRTSTVARARDAELFDFLVMYSATRGAFGISDAASGVQARLEDLGFLVPDERVSQPVLFACDITAARDPLRPQRHSARPPAVNGNMVVSPTYRFHADGPTKAMRGRFNLANPFRSDRVWFSVGGGVAAPRFYSAPANHRTVLARLEPGSPAPPDLPSALRDALIDADVLAKIPSDVDAPHDAEIARRRDTLRNQRWVVLEEIIQPAQIAAVRRYYRDLIGEGFVRFADPEWPNRFFASRDPLTYFFQHQLTDLMSAIAGEPLKPSFSFLASYRPGAELKPHRDREQCHYAMSVLLDHGHDSDVSNWPLYMQPPGAKEGEPVRAALGDGLLYFGEEVVHYRYPLTDGYSTLWFLFWVPQDYVGPLD